MTPQDRLEEIKRLQVPSGNPTSRSFSTVDRDWLIFRVEQLEVCLSQINDLLANLVKK